MLSLVCNRADVGIGARGLVINKNKTMKRNIIPILMLVCAIGCATVYSSIVTVTQVVDTTMKAWADLSKGGHTSAAIDAKVVLAHDKYREACAVAQASLIEYKRTGDSTTYVQALAVAKVAAQGILDIVAPLLNPVDAVQIQSNLEKATKI